MTELLHRELTEKIIGAYYDVYNRLGQAYPEYIYESAMMRALERQGIRCARQDEYTITYRDWIVGAQRLDIFVAGDVVVELKVQPELTDLHAAQAISYLKTVGKQVGLLFNFGDGTPAFRRLYYNEREPAPPPSRPSVRDGLLYPDLVYEIVGALYRVHYELGPGYIYRIYANATYRELQSRGLRVQPLRRMTVFYAGESVGHVKLDHLLVERSVMVFPRAQKRRLGATAAIHPEPLRRWMADQDIRLGILANFHRQRMEPLFMKEDPASPASHDKVESEG